MTPTVRSRRYLEQRGWTCGVTQRYVHQIQRYFDLFGFIDLVCMHPDDGFLAVQVTAGGNGSARIKKILDTENARKWLAAGGKIEVHDWRTIKTGKRRLWEPRITGVTEEALV